MSAEKSFSTALYLNQNNAEALNGLGLARVQRGRPRDAAKFFAAAVQVHPDYAPAILNLATVEQQYLHDNKLGAGTLPRVSGAHAAPGKLGRGECHCQQSRTARDSHGCQSAAGESKPITPRPNPSPVASETKEYSRRLSSSRDFVHAQPVTRISSYSPPHPPQVVKVQPEPVIVRRRSGRGRTPNQPVEPPPEKASLWHTLNPVNWFGSSAPEKAKKYGQNGVTPLPSRVRKQPRGSMPVISGASDTAFQSARAGCCAEACSNYSSLRAPTFPRYLYLSPRKPKAGDRQAASFAFAKAREFEQGARWSDAMESYRRAAESDPAGSRRNIITA